MITIDDVTKKIRIQLAGVPTNELEWNVTYIGEPAYGNADGTTNGTTPVDMVLGSSAIPNTSVYGTRSIATVSVFNADVANSTIEILYYNGTTDRVIVRAILKPNYTLHYENERGWYATDDDGATLENTGTGGGVGMEIGAPVTGGSTNGILYVNGSGDLAQLLPSSIGQIPFHDEQSKLSFERIPSLPAVKSFTGGSISNPPGSPANGDAYVLIDDIGSYSGMLQDINWQSGNTVRYTVQDFSLMSTWEGYGHVGIGDVVVITTAGDSINNGKFIMTAWDLGSQYFEVTNPAVVDNSHDESGTPATAFWTDILWGGAGVGDWVRYNSGAGTWRWITPANGQTVLNITDKEYYVFKNDAWTSQAYVLPTQPYSMRMIAENLLAMNTTSDQTVTIGNLPGTTGFTKFMPLHIWLWNSETVFTLGDDLQFWTGAGRTGTHLWTFTAAELAQLTFDGMTSSPIGFAYFGPPATNVLLPTTIYASLGTSNVTSSAIRVRIAGWPQF